MQMCRAILSLVLSCGATPVRATHISKGDFVTRTDYINLVTIQEKKISPEPKITFKISYICKYNDQFANFALTVGPIL